MILAALRSKTSWRIHHPPPDPTFPAIIAAYLPIYNLAGTLEEILAEPYRRTLPPLLDGFHTGTQVGAAMPSDLLRICGLISGQIFAPMPTTLYGSHSATTTFMNGLPAHR